MYFGHYLWPSTRPGHALPGTGHPGAALQMLVIPATSLPVSATVACLQSPSRVGRPVHRPPRRRPSRPRPSWNRPPRRRPPNVVHPNHISPGADLFCRCQSRLCRSRHRPSRKGISRPQPPGATSPGHSPPSARSGRAPPGRSAAGGQLTIEEASEEAPKRVSYMRCRANVNNSHD